MRSRMCSQIKIKLHSVEQRVTLQVKEIARGDENSLPGRQITLIRSDVLRIVTEISLSSFKFWSEAAVNAEKLTPGELTELEGQIESMFPEGVDATQLNDLLWFDFESVCDWLGLDADEVGER